MVIACYLQPQGAMRRRAIRSGATILIGTGALLFCSACADAPGGSGPAGSGGASSTGGSGPTGGSGGASGWGGGPTAGSGGTGGFGGGAGTGAGSGGSAGRRG